MAHDEDRKVAAKEVVETLKKKLVALQNELSVIKPRHGKGDGSDQRKWDAYHAKKREWVDVSAKLSDAKLELIRLSGDDRVRPQWEMAYTAYAVLSRLDDAGVDIGQHGRDLLDMIEDHAPPAKLDDACAKIASWHPAANPVVTKP